MRQYIPDASCNVQDDTIDTLPVAFLTEFYSTGNLPTIDLANVSRFLFSLSEYGILATSNPRTDSHVLFMLDVQHGRRPPLPGHESSELYLSSGRYRDVSKGWQDCHTLDRRCDWRRRVHERFRGASVRASDLGHLPGRKQRHEAIRDGCFGRVRSRSHLGRLGDRASCVSRLTCGDDPRLRIGLTWISKGGRRRDTPLS